MRIGSAISSALNGINEASQNLNANAQRIQEEGISSETVVNSKVNEHSIRANLATVGTILETEGHILDMFG